MKVSVVIATFGRFEALLQTAKEILRQENSQFELIIVDQNPEWPKDLQREKASLAEQSCVKWKTLNERGVVNARQAGVAESDGEILLFCDDDVYIPDSHFLKRHAANYVNPEITAVCGREVISGHREVNLNKGPEGPISIGNTPLELQPIMFPRASKTKQYVCTFCTCNASVRRESFFAIGGFDENFQGASYGDDYDFAIRLCQAGGKIIFDPAAWLIHRQAPSGGLRLSDNRQPFTEREKALSGWIFLLRHGVSGWRFYLFYRWVLRRTVLLRSTVLKPHRIPRAVYGAWTAYFLARRAVRSGPKSRFNNTLH